MTTHGKSIKVRPPPDTQAFSDLPIIVGWLDVSPFTVGNTKTFIESDQETFLVGLAGIEVPSGTIISHVQSDVEDYLQLVKGIGDLKDEDVWEAVILDVSASVQACGMGSMMWACGQSRKLKSM